MSVSYTDNSMQVRAAIGSVVSAFLEEAGGEIRSRTQRNSRVDTGRTKGSYEYKVEEKTDEGTVYIGSNYENAVWEEYGTGEYALEGGGRKGYWVFVKGSSGAKRSGRTYTLEEAKRVMAILRSRGLDAYYTKGKRANRPLYNAFNALKGTLESVLASKLNSI